MHEVTVRQNLPGGLGRCWPFAQHAVQRILIAGWFVGEALKQLNVAVPGGAE